LLLGVFFFTIGMKIDVREILAQPLLLFGCVAGLIVLKVAIALPLMRAFRVPWRASVEASLMLGPGGEFAFVGIGLATAATIVDRSQASFALAVTSISMALIPVLYHLARRADGLVADQPHAEVPEPAGKEDRRTIVIGHGRVGRMLTDMLDRHGVPFIAIESDVNVAAAERRRGRHVYFGNATDLVYLERCGLSEARAIVITIHDRKTIDEIIGAVRKVRPDLTIVARARDEEHARHLYGLGVTDAVPETIEASLQLSEAVLVGVGIATGPVIASIHERRDEVRRELQDAAITAGRAESRSIRASTTGRG
jgi:K+:H+ antiporter